MKPFYFSKRKLQFVPAATILVALAISIPISAQTITTFDAPGTGPGQVWSIAPNGAVTGFFFDPNNVGHGYVRAADAGALGVPKFYRTVTSGRTMPLRNC